MHRDEAVQWDDPRAQICKGMPTQMTHKVRVPHFPPSKYLEGEPLEGQAGVGLDVDKAPSVAALEDDAVNLGER